MGSVRYWCCVCYNIYEPKRINNIKNLKVATKANRIALSRIFSNLMSNAIKYSDGDLEICLTNTKK